MSVWGFLSWRLQEEEEEEVLICCGFPPHTLAGQLFCYEISLQIFSGADGLRVDITLSVSLQDISHHENTLLVLVTLITVFYPLPTSCMWNIQPPRTLKVDLKSSPDK